LETKKCELDFGEEWVRAMMTLPKIALILMIKEIVQNNEEKRKEDNGVKWIVASRESKN